MKESQRLICTPTHASDKGIVCAFPTMTIIVDQQLCLTRSFPALDIFHPPSLGT